MIARRQRQMCIRDSFNANNKNLSEDISRFILNYDMADQFAGSQPLVLEDTTGNWINYGLEYLKIGTAKDALFRLTKADLEAKGINTCLLYTSPSPRDRTRSRMPSSA